MPLQIDVQLTGEDEVEKRLTEMARDFPVAATKAAKAGAEIVRAGAVKSIRSRGEETGTKTTKSGREVKTYAALGAPIADKLTSRTGALRASIRSEQSGTGEYSVGPTVKYGRIHEFGGEIQVSAHTVLSHWRHLADRSTKVKAYTRGGWVTKMPARPYLTPGYEDNADRVKREMIRTLTVELGRGQ